MDTARKSVIRSLIVLMVVCAGLFLYSSKSLAATYTESESNNYMGSADVVTIKDGDEVKGNLSNSNDVDFFRFTIANGSEVDLSFIGNTSDCVMRYYIYKSDEIDYPIINGSVKYNENLGYLYEDWTYYLSAGTYYLKLDRSMSSSNCGYTVNFNLLSWENFSEPNNVIGSATPITTKKKYKGIIESYDEYDFFKFTASTSGYYYIKIDNINVGDDYHSADCLQINTFNNTGNKIEVFEGDYVKGSYQSVAYGSSKTELVKLPKGTTYFRFESACNDDGKYQLTVVKLLPAPSKVSVKLYGYDDIQATWSTVSGASGYYVYYKRSTASGYKYLGNYKGTSATIKNLSDGVKYYVKIVPYTSYDGTAYKGSSKTSSGIYTLKKLNSPSIKKSSSSYVRVYWNNISGETGYQIAKSKYKSKGYSVVKTVSSKYKNYKIKTSRNKTYYYKVRAYKTVGDKKIYGPWSSVKSYKLK